jgi:hypothetical protein
MEAKIPVLQKEGNGNSFLMKIPTSKIDYCVSFEKNLNICLLLIFLKFEYV